MPMKNRFWALFVVSWLSIFSASAESLDPPILVRPIAPAEPVVPGKPAMVTVEICIPNLYHINSDRPLQDFLIPTTLEFASDPAVVVNKVIFPAPVVKKFKFSQEPLAVFEGIVGIKAELSIPSQLTSKEIALKGRVRYQACDEQTCFPPEVQSFTLTIPVTSLEGFSSADKTIEMQHGAEKEPGARKDSTGSLLSGSADFSGRSLPAKLLLIFVAGLALNLTPCVYPMIPITITYFGGQALGKKGSILMHSLLYVLGMAITYSTLGVVAAMTGGLFGGAHQHPAVLIGISLVMVLLALSMFDVYELRLPQVLTRVAGGGQKGFWGTFLMGLTVGIVAAPCVGPFVLGLMTYVGRQGSAILGFILFFVLALGLGLPFLLLGVFSGSLHRLPKSGAWLVWVRKIFGFVLLLMAVFFLETIFRDQLAYHLTFGMILFLAGIYLAWIDQVPSSGRIFPIMRNLVGLAFFAAALYAVVTGLDAEIRANRGGSAEANSLESIKWVSYSEEILHRARQEGKPVFIDFYADWCAPCKELDRHTFVQPEAIRLSREFIMVKVDLTSAGNPEAETLRRKYGVPGVPTLVFLNAEGEEMTDLRSTGFESAESFIDKMRRALQRNLENRGQRKKGA